MRPESMEALAGRINRIEAAQKQLLKQLDDLREKLEQLQDQVREVQSHTLVDAGSAE